MKQNPLSTKKKIILSAALAGLVAGVSLSSTSALAHGGKKDVKSEKHKCKDMKDGKHECKDMKDGKHKCKDMKDGEKKSCKDKKAKGDKKGCGGAKGCGTL